MSLLLTLAAVEERTPADANPLWYWFGIFVFLAVSVVLLWLSLRRHLNRIDFEEEPDEPRGGDARPKRA